MISPDGPKKELVTELSHASGLQVGVKVAVKSISDSYMTARL